MIGGTKMNFITGSVKMYSTAYKKHFLRRTVRNFTWNFAEVQFQNKKDRRTDEEAEERKKERGKGARDEGRKAVCQSETLNTPH